MTEITFMEAALHEAEKAFHKEEIPVGAVAVVRGKVIAKGHNQKEEQRDATAHAELLCLQKTARKLGRWRLSDVTLFTTLEPCPMCAGAMIQARLGKLVYGLADPKAGAAGSVIDLFRVKQFNHRVPVVSGVLAEKSLELLQRFFKKLRKRRRDARVVEGGCLESS